MVGKKTELSLEPQARRFAPMDFHRFRHTTWRHTPQGRRTAWNAPYWLVGVSPFEREMTDTDGHVVHLGSPRFVARWTFDDEKFHLGNGQRHFFDDELGLLIYEVSLLDEFTVDLDEWLREAACAVAFSQGLICAMDAVEEEA